MDLKTAAKDVLRTLLHASYYTKEMPFTGIHARVMPTVNGKAEEIPTAKEIAEYINSICKDAIKITDKGIYIDFEDSKYDTIRKASDYQFYIDMKDRWDDEDREEYSRLSKVINEEGKKLFGDLYS